MKKVSRFLSIVAVAFVGFTSCSKTGDTGPAGPEGPQGPAGPQSVYSSPWIELNFNDDTYDTTLVATTITKAILDSGVILSYLNAPDSDGTYYVYPLSALTSDFFEEFSIGSIYLAERVNDYEGLKYRYVTIPGALVTGNGANKKVKGYTVPELTAMPYEKVQEIVQDKN